jgi:hypothetical protein
MKNPGEAYLAGILFNPNLLPQRKTKLFEGPIEQRQIEL